MSQVKEIEIVHIWEFAVEFMQIPIIAFIIFLSIKAKKVMKLPSLKWVYIAFIFNLLYILNSIWESHDTHFLKLENTDLIRNILSVCFDVMSYSLFYWGALNYWINNEYLHYNKFTLINRLRFWLSKNIALTKLGIIILLVLTSIGILIFSVFVEDSMRELYFRGIFNFFALLGMAWFFRQNPFMVAGFLFWSSLQLWMFYPNKIIYGEFFKASAFSISMFAKGLILFGLFSKYVTKVSETVIKFKEEEQKAIDEKNAKEKEILEKEKIEKIKDELILILRTTFHEIITPLKSLETTVEKLQKIIGREKIEVYQQLVSDSEIIKTVIVVANWDFSEKLRRRNANNIAQFYQGEVQVFNLNTLIQNAVRSIKNTTPSKDMLKFKLTYAPKCYIECNRNEVIQVIVNILKNIIEAYESIEAKEYKIYIKSSLSKKEPNQMRFAVLEIEDRAGGIPNEIIDKVWERGFSTKKIEHDDSSRGMGLFISKTIIEKYAHSSIKLKSPIVIPKREPLKGTKFTIKFQLQEINRN